MSPNVVKCPPMVDGTPSDRMRQGAFTTHRARVSVTEAKLRAVIGNLRDRGETIKISSVAAELGMSREHLSRRYGNFISKSL
jgi:transcriptional regulator GlxA family with amidase domain